MKTNTETSWGSVARALHWLMALLIAVQLALGWVGHEMEDSPAKITWLTGHKSLGLTILLLLAFRWLWRLSQPLPRLPEPRPGWVVVGSRITHWGLYLVPLALAVSGWLIADTSRIPWAYWWLVPLPDLVGADHDLHEAAEEIHELLVACLLALVSLHVVAALWHQLGRRDGLLRRMWSG